MEEPSLLLLQSILVYLFGLQLTDTREATSRFWALSGTAFRIVVAVGVTSSVEAVLLTLIIARNSP